MWVEIREHVGRDQRKCLLTDQKTWVTDQRARGYRSENMWVEIREHVGRDQRTCG